MDDQPLCRSCDERPMAPGRDECAPCLDFRRERNEPPAALPPCRFCGSTTARGFCPAFTSPTYCERTGPALPESLDDLHDGAACHRCGDDHPDGRPDAYCLDIDEDAPAAVPCWWCGHDRPADAPACPRCGWTEDEPTAAFLELRARVQRRMVADRERARDRHSEARAGGITGDPRTAAERRAAVAFVEYRDGVREAARLGLARTYVRRLAPIYRAACPAYDRDECAMARERLAAGIADTVAPCLVHG